MCGGKVSKIGKARRPACVDEEKAFGRKAVSMIFKNLSFYSVKPAYLVVVVYFLFIRACSSPDDKQPITAQPAAFSDSLNITEEVHAKYAEGFSISYHQNYKLLKVFNPFVDQPDTLRYLLVPRNTKPPRSYPNAQVIKIPVRNVIATSTTHIALSEMLAASEKVKGMVGAKYVYSPTIRQRVKTGDLTAFRPAGFNKEKALAMNPDLIMLSAGQVSEFNDFKMLAELGISIFVNAEWLETTPLGKAEWVKVMAALLNKEALANERFAAVAKKYNYLKKIVNEKVDEKPLVINNMPYKGAWFVSGGDSFTAQYLKDAGADYSWFENDETGGLRRSFEAIYWKGLRAEVWINPGAAASLEEIIAKDARLKDFKAFRTRRIYNNNKRLSPSGGNDFWETGVVRPDLVLRDLINIFHPGLLKNDALYFYQQLTTDYAD